MPVLVLTLEGGIGLAMQSQVGSVREIAHEADQRLAVLPNAAAHATQDAPQGIEVSIARLHFRASGRGTFL